MSTDVYSWEEVAEEIAKASLIVVKECPRFGDFAPSQLENCQGCDNFFGFEKITPADPVIWEYKPICRAPLSRHAIKVR